LCGRIFVSPIVTSASALRFRADLVTHFPELIRALQETPFSLLALLSRSRWIVVNFLAELWSNRRFSPPISVCSFNLFARARCPVEFALLQVIPPVHRGRRVGSERRRFKPSIRRGAQGLSQRIPSADIASNVLDKPIRLESSADARSEVMTAACCP
jgi:hypothetical protein